MKCAYGVVGQGVLNPDSQSIIYETMPPVANTFDRGLGPKPIKPTINSSPVTVIDSSDDESTTATPSTSRQKADTVMTTPTGSRFAVSPQGGLLGPADVPTPTPHQVSPTTKNTCNDILTKMSQ